MLEVGGPPSPPPCASSGPIASQSTSGSLVLPLASPPVELEEAAAAVDRVSGGVRAVLRSAWRS